MRISTSAFWSLTGMNRTSDPAVQIRILSITARNGGEEILLRVELREAPAGGSSAESEAGHLSERADGAARSEVREFLLISERYMALRPARGPIDEATFEAIEEAAAFSAAVRSGLRMLAFGGNTRRALESKLVQKGTARETAREAVLYLSERGYISEGEDAIREAERNVLKLRGRNRIRAALYAKGYGSEAMEAAERYLDGVDFEDLCGQLIERRYAAEIADPALHKKLAATLMRSGFTMSEIRAAIRSAGQ